MATARFVQIPTDESAPLGAFEHGYSFRALAGLPAVPLDPARQAECAGLLGALLHRYSQQARIAIDVALGIPASPRPLDLVVEEGATVAALIEQAGAFLRQAGDGPTLALDTPSNVAMSFVDAPGVPAKSIDGSEHLPAAPRYDLHFLLARTCDGHHLGVRYNARLFQAATAQRVVGGYVALLEAGLRDRGLPVGELPLLGSSALTGAPGEEGEGEATTPAVRLFESLAAEQPEAIAAISHGERATYRELDARANRLAHYLIASGVGPDVPVAVCVRPSLEILVALLAIFKARGLYLPLDPTHPPALLARMLEEARPRLVLTTSALAGCLPASRFKLLCFDDDGGALQDLPAASPPLRPSPDDAAYLFYTSGTTDKPKGVVATQGNLAHYLAVARRRYGFGPADGFCSLARYTFSISLFELLSPLTCGGRLRLLDRDEVLVPERLSQALQDVTVLHAGPSLLGALFRYLRATPSAPRSFPGIRHASSGGDMVLPSVMEEMKRVFENAEIFVIYGCTEISCMGTTFPVERDRHVTRTYVGAPFPGVQVSVVDGARRPVPLGVVGEICFAGRGISRGYLERAELTAEKYVELDGRRWYRTGDLGRVHPDGNLEILGRRDFQVQLRGIRIELAGIEKTVLNLGLAEQCAVVCKRPAEEDVRLVAFAVKPTVATAAAFRSALGAELPDYMLPHHVVSLDAMPLTANGKLDRARLQELPWEHQLGNANRVSPQDDLERQLVGVLAKVLGVAEMGVEDSFFDLGGDSLRAVVAIQEIEAALGLALEPQVLFEHGTVRALARQAREARSTALRPILLGGTDRLPPVFLLSGVAQYRALARHLGTIYSAYGVFLDREVRRLGPDTLPASVQQLAREYVEVVRRAQTAGPYRLIGYSFAGIVAYQVALQLLSCGEEVRFLGLIDAQLPEWTQSWRFRWAQLGRVRTVSPPELVKLAKRRLQERLGLISRTPFARHQDDAALGPLEERRDRMNQQAAAEYLAEMPSYDGGAVTVITSAERLRRDPLHSPSCGWSPYVPEIRLHQVGADHFRLLSDEPYVSQMAEALLGDMQRSEPAQA